VGRNVAAGGHHQQISVTTGSSLLVLCHGSASKVCCTFCSAACL
jgi:hypothetical protein